MGRKPEKPTRLFSPATPSMMDRWNEQKAKLKKKFPELTNNDLKYKEGRKNEMFANLRVKLGVSPEDWKKIMEDL
jgi:uncharacterized protein YjbJ (UPF0337 family)